MLFKVVYLNILKHNETPSTAAQHDNFFSWACAKWHCSQVRSLLFAEQSRRPSAVLLHAGWVFQVFNLLRWAGPKRWRLILRLPGCKRAVLNTFLLKPAVSQGLEMWRDIKSGSCWKGTYLLCKTCFLSFCKTFRISVGKCHGQVFSRMPFCMPLILKKRDFASSESFW